MKQEPGFFDFAAEVGLTKHIGGLQATETLLQLCQIQKDSHILDVGCGVGATPCFIAKKYGCQVTGVDISPRMIERSIERAKREKVADRTEFRVADAQDLPFEPNLFDIVMTESVTAFPQDKQKAVNEYARVTRPGGYVGLNESAWLKTPVPPEMAAWAEQEVGASVQPLTPDAWTALLTGARLKVVQTKTYAINLEGETKGILSRYGFVGMLKVFGRMIRLYTKSPDYRKFVKDVRQGGIVPEKLDEYFGYGLFVGQKNFT